MPELDGLEVLSSVRADPDTRALPVVLLTASAADSDLAEGLRRGATGYLTKPFTLDEFTAATQAALATAPD